MRLPPEGCCLLCPVAAAVPAVATWVDTLGFRYPLCERHYRPLAAWQRRRHEQEQRRALERRAYASPEGR